MKFRRSFFFFVLPLASLAIFLSAPSAAAGVQLASYTIADDTGDWGYPTPHRRYARGPGYLRMGFLFDTLTWKNEAGELIPALAESWEYLDAQNAYLFKLNPEARWNDGTPFTSEDLVFTVQYLKKHPTPWVNPKNIEKAEPRGPHIVKLTLIQKDASFLTDVAGTFAVLPRHIWAGVVEPRKFGGEKALVGTGPFKLLDYNQAQGSYLYESRERYYGGKPKVRRLKFIKVAPEMIAAALKQNAADAGPIPPDLAAEMKRAGFRVIRAPYGWNLKLVMNHRKPPLDQKVFRQALAYAIDRKALVEITQRGHAMAGNPGFVPPDSPWYNPRANQYDFNLARAGELLKGIGYEVRGGKILRDGGPLKLELLSQPHFREVGLFIKQQLERLGLEVALRSLESKTLDSRVLHWQFQLAISGHGGLYEPSFLTRRILSQDFNSVRYMRNEELTRLLNAQLREMDPVKRKIIVMRIQEIYAEDIPNLTLFYPNSYFAHNGRIPLFYNRNGISIGIPLPLNKIAFVERKSGSR
jgi:peptide/nickel transport system substrate-binding protein